MKPILQICTSIALASSLHAATWTVDNVTSRPANFRTIQAAVDAAAVGDTLLVAGSSVRYGNINLNKRIIIKGPGNTTQIGVTAYSGAVVFGTDVNPDHPENGIEASGSVIEGMQTERISIRPGCSGATIKRCNPYSITTDGNNTMIINCFVGRSASINGVNCRIIGTFLPLLSIYKEGALIEQCILNSDGMGFDKPLDLINGLKGMPSFINTILVSQSTYYSSIYNVGSYDHCMAIGWGVLPNINGNISIMKNQYLEVFHSTASSLNLKADGLAIGVGKGGYDLGVYGGARPYVSGYVPALPRVSGLTLPAVVPDSAGLTFEVSAEARE